MARILGWNIVWTENNIIGKTWPCDNIMFGTWVNIDVLSRTCVAKLDLLKYLLTILDWKIIL